MNKQILLLIVVLVLIVGVGLLIYFYPRHPDCAFSGWKNTLGVELDAEIQNLNAVKGKLGITDAQVHEYDALLKDYALKYDSVCQDSRAGRISQAEYTCRRRNMDNVLDDLRRFSVAIEQSKNVTDPAAQKEVVLRALDDLRANSKSQYRTGCTSAMDVNPKKLAFTGLIPERSIQVTNRGNNDLVFSVDGAPEAFDPRPPSGPLLRGTTVSISFVRTIFPLPKDQPIRLHVRTNLLDDEVIELTADAENAQLYSRLAEQVASVARNRTPTLNDALAVVESSLPQNISGDRESLKDYLAAGVLIDIGNNRGAQQALDAAITKEPSIAKQPTTAVLHGVIADKRNDPNQALRYFSTAKRLAQPTDTNVESIADLFSAAIQLRRGNQSAASAHLSNPAVHERLQRNPGSLAYAEHQFHSPALATELKF
jgi:tetratricopeptide (TPR) repeat protein